ncbi:MAG: DUF3089 domain-containing protein [Pseudohongiellaceae bacterium]
MKNQLSTRSKVVAGIATLFLATAGTTIAQSLPVDFADGQNWLCRGTDSSLGACDADLDTTIVNADGRLNIEKFIRNENPAIDCFYVYPTVSLDTTPNSDMNAGPEEYNVIAQQFARFGSKCRTFAPMYRQLTLAMILGGEGTPDRQLGYNDVLDAWNYYLEHYNAGRGVVLVGHSQGSGVLTSLIRNEIDGKPVQQQIISAMLLGTTVQVPAGQNVGATFQHMPLCTSGDQTQCIIVIASFRSTVPPTATSLFGRNGQDSVSGCTNPASLAKGSNEVHAYLNAAPGRTGVDSWTTEIPRLETPFASAPGLLTTECVSSATHTYLEIRVHGNPDDPRTDDIGGDIINAEGRPDAGWGMHLIDANLAMGDLLTIVDRQTVSYLRDRP